MRKIIKLQEKFFSWDYNVIVLALQAATLAMLYSLLYVFYLPSKVAVIWAMIGVFVNALIQTVAIEESLQNRFCGGIIIAFSAGVTTFFGSYYAHSFVAMSICLILIVPFVGLYSSARAISAAIILFTVDLFIVGSGVPGDFIHALSYGIGFTLGGLTLTFAAFSYAKLFKQKDVQSTGYKFAMQDLVIDYNSNKKFAILLTIVVFAANFISYHFNMPQGFWIPMTALLILKSDYDFTKSRMSHRLFGTILGSLLAIVIAIVFLSKLAMALLMFPLLFFIVVSMARHYGAYTLILTIMVTVMVNLIEQQGYLIAEHRLIDTFVGVVVVVSALWWIQPLIEKLHIVKK